MFLIFLFNFFVSLKCNKVSKIVNKRKVLILFVATVLLIAICFAVKAFCFSKPKKTNNERIKITKEEFEKKVDQVVEKIEKIANDIYASNGDKKEKLKSIENLVIGLMKDISSYEPMMKNCQIYPICGCLFRESSSNSLRPAEDLKQDIKKTCELLSKFFKLSYNNPQYNNPKIDLFDLKPEEVLVSENGIVFNTVAKRDDADYTVVFYLIWPYRIHKNDWSKCVSFCLKRC